jgi:alpha-glucosidase/alpha-D-xyloside xylohydrolase
MIRALWLHYPEDPIAVTRSDEYLWGRDVLVAPVFEKGASTRKVYLPRGKWFDFWTEELIDGGREIERKVDLATMPLYVRAGAVLPLGPVKQYSDEPANAPLSLIVYPGPNNAATLYDDDGKSFNHRRGEFMKMEMAWTESNKRLRLRLLPGSRMLPPNRLPVEVRVAGQSRVIPATFEGKTLEINC